MEIHIKNNETMTKGQAREALSNMLKMPLANNFIFKTLAQKTFELLLMGMPHIFKPVTTFLTAPLANSITYLCLPSLFHLLKKLLKKIL